MMDTPTIDTIFTNVVDIVHAIARKFYRHFGGDLAELTAEAEYQFLEAHSRYTPEKGTFEGWIKFRIWHNLLELRRRNAKEASRRAEVDVNYLMSRGERFKLVDFLEALSEDAKRVVQLLLSDPSHKPKKGRLRMTLRGIGWTASRIIESFNEITKVLTGG